MLCLQVRWDFGSSYQHLWPHRGKGEGDLRGVHMIQAITRHIQKFKPSITAGKSLRDCLFPEGKILSASLSSSHTQLSVVCWWQRCRGGWVVPFPVPSFILSTFWSPELSRLCSSCHGGFEDAELHPFLLNVIIHAFTLIYSKT